MKGPDWFVQGRIVRNYTTDPGVIIPWGGYICTSSKLPGSTKEPTAQYRLRRVITSRTPDLAAQHSHSNTFGNLG